MIFSHLQFIVNNEGTNIEGRGQRESKENNMFSKHVWSFDGVWRESRARSEC